MCSAVSPISFASLLDVNTDKHWYPVPSVWLNKAYIYIYVCMYIYKTNPWYHRWWCNDVVSSFFIPSHSQLLRFSLAELCLELLCSSRPNGLSEWSVWLSRNSDGKKERVFCCWRGWCHVHCRKKYAYGLWLVLVRGQTCVCDLPFTWRKLEIPIRHGTKTRQDTQEPWHERMSVSSLAWRGLQSALK